MRLLPLLRSLVGRRAAPAGGEPAADSPFLRQMVVESLRADGRAVLRWQKAEGTVLGTPITDEWIQPGDRVWVSETSRGRIIHGTVK